MAVYVRHPSTPVQPSRLNAPVTHAQLYRTVAVQSEAAEHAALTIVVQFVDALQRNDPDDMRVAFPTITRGERRILRGVRNRLGTEVELAVRSPRVRRADAGVTELDFVIVATEAGRTRERRLPFSATVRRHSGEWKIVELR